MINDPPRPTPDEFLREMIANLHRAETNPADVVTIPAGSSVDDIVALMLAPPAVPVADLDALADDFDRLMQQREVASAVVDRAAPLFKALAKR
jgi:hypothetical protein